MNRISVHIFQATCIVELVRKLPTCIWFRSLRMKMKRLFKGCRWWFLQSRISWILELVVVLVKIDQRIILGLKEWFGLWKMSQNSWMKKLVSLRYVMRSRRMPFEKIGNPFDMSFVWAISLRSHIHEIHVLKLRKGVTMHIARNPSRESETPFLYSFCFLRTRLLVFRFIRYNFKIPCRIFIYFSVSNILCDYER